MAESDIVLKIGADTEQIKKDLEDLKNSLIKNPPGKGAGDEFGNSFKENIIAVNQGLELLKKAFDFGKAIVEFTKIGEEADASVKRFQLLAEQAGLVPEAIVQGIERSTHGLVSMNDALQAASGSVVSLGKNAERIPELFDLATKVSKVFGGEAIDNFERLSMAISTGNQKTLNRMGIQIDVNQVTEDYARKLGLTVDFLSEAQKQQALLNAVLEESKTKYKDVGESLTPVSDSIKRLTVSFHDWGESISSALGKLIGPAIAEGAKNLSNEFAVWGKLINGDLSAMDALRVIIGSNDKALEEMLAKTKEAGGAVGGPGSLEMQKKTADAILQLTAAQKQKLKELELKADQELLSSRKAAADQHLQIMMEAGLTEEEYQIALNERIALTQEDHQLRLKQIEEEYRVLRTLDNQKYNELIEQEDARHAEAVAATYQDLTKRVQQNGLQIAQTIKGALVQSISQGVQTIVKNLMTGKNAFSGFVSLVANLMGDLAIQLGTLFISTGIAIEATKSLSGFAAVVAGIGLIAVGTILKALAGGGGSAESAGGGGGGGGYAGGFGGPQEMNMTREEERNTPQTGVHVTVQGNIFDSKETGLQIAQILNDSFDLSGTLVRANA